MTAASLRATPPSGRLDFLDGVRAASALFVLVHHAFMSSHLVGADGRADGWPGWVFGWALWGHFGVTIFIVLAGYSLALGVARHDGHLPGGLLDYLKRRAWRIVPPYWIALTLTIILTIVYLHRMTGTHWDLSLPVSHKGWVVDYFLLQEVIPVHDAAYTFWSISVEFHIYLLLPVMVAVWRFTNWVTATWVGAAIGLIGILLAQFVDYRFGRFQPTYYLVFALAVGACIATHRAPAAMARIPWRTVGVVLAGAVVLMCAVQPGEWVEGNYFWIDGIVGGAVICLIVAMRAGTAPGLARMFAWRPLAGVAAFSYSLYLIHAPLLQVFWQVVIEPFDLSPLVQLAILWGVACPLIIAIAYGFYRVAEKPFLPLARSQASRRPVTADISPVSSSDGRLRRVDRDSREV